MNAINAIVAFDNAMNELVMDEARGNIFLVGMMGAGKTTIGRLLAGFLKKTFYDSDREIQKKNRRQHSPYF